MYTKHSGVPANALYVLRLWRGYLGASPRTVTAAGVWWRGAACCRECFWERWDMAVSYVLDEAHDAGIIPQDEADASDDGIYCDHCGEQL